jgi:hypothetical protein
MLPTLLTLLSLGLIAIASILWVEIVRDTYHALSHYVPPLIRLHNWHHRVFRPDLSVVSPEIYRKAHWYNDVPEALVMLLLSAVLVWALVWGNVAYAWVGAVGPIYTLVFLGSAIARGAGVPHVDEWTDVTHRPGEFSVIPAPWLINRSYHWRHHFDNQKAYYSSTFTFFDKFLGTALSLKGKTVAVTGASGSLGRALLGHLLGQGAKVIALSSREQPIVLNVLGKPTPIPTITWQVGQEAKLLPILETVDILILNHGINVHSDRSAEAIAQSYEVNSFSSWRLMETFFTTVQTNKDKVCKEVWVNTSEAEVNPAFSPLYELSKRTLGDIVTLRRLDAPCIVRKLILGPFKSDLNPVGIMSANWVAQQILWQAKRDFREIIVTINPITYLFFPLKEGMTHLYFKLFSKSRISKSRK